MTGGYFTRTYEHWRATIEKDPIGTPVETWAKLGDVSGRAYPASSSDSVESGLAIDMIVWTFACPSTVDLKTGDQIRFDGRTLTVRNVPVTSRGERIEARCEEVN